MMGVNLLLLLLTVLFAQAGAVMIVAIVFSALALNYIFVSNAIVSFSGLNEVFSAPRGYLPLLTPLPAWKLLLGRIIPAAVMDTIGFLVSLGWLLHHSFSFAFGFVPIDMGQYVSARDIALGVGAGFAAYPLFLIMFCFFRALSKSVFYRVRLRVLLSLLVTFVIMGTVLSWFGFLLLPFGTMHRVGLLFHISIGSVTGAGAAMVVLVLLIQAATLFAATSYLTERKINL